MTVYNGIDPAKFRRQRSRKEARDLLRLPNDDRLLIGGVGRLDDAKGFDYLIDALALLAAGHPHANLVIAGRGPRLEELQMQARRAGVADRVFFLGFCPEVDVVYDALDVLSAPSLCEALSYVVQEAMSHELPVVGSRIGGIPELIVPGETGSLVACRSATELAAALAPLLKSEELRLHMGRAGRTRIMNGFTESEMVRRTCEIYREMLGTGTSTLADPRPG